MIQEITIPEKTLEHIFSEIHMSIINKDAVTGRVIIARRPVGSVERPQFLPTGVDITAILTEALAAGDLTAANITGFKKCLRAICAKAAETTFTNLNEVL
jgi:hypothetical protein